MDLKQKLANLVKTFGDKSLSKDILGEGPEDLSKVTLHFNLETNLITVSSDDVDAKGRPIHEWELNKETGHVTKTQRTVDGSEVKIIHQDVDVTEQKKEVVKVEQKPEEKTVVIVEKVKETAIETGVAGSNVGQWADLETQKDIAFKLMYILMVFTFATCFLTYIFFKMVRE